MKSIGNPPTIPTTPAMTGPVRLASVDAYRGFVMLLILAAETVRLRTVARALPDSSVWKFLSWHQTHVPWVGGTLHDMIQPSFSFLVGVALPFSIASRTARGSSRVRMTAHALWRALLLILLGVFLRSLTHESTHWTFQDTLAQIGLGYGFLFVLGFGSTRAHWIGFSAILVGCWAAYALWPLPTSDFDYRQVGVFEEWLAAHGLTGFAAHWQKNSSLGWAFDTWFLNLFPRDKEFLFNPGGTVTLNFVPTLATMILGLIAANVLRSTRSSAAKLHWLLVAGLVGVTAGTILDRLGLCPNVKRLWTPSWVLFSGGICLWFLAAYYWVIDVKQVRRWAFPLIVVGMNSIAAYVMAHLFPAFIEKTLVTHLGASSFRLFGAPYESALRGITVLLVMWLLLYWMYRRKLFLKI